ncbi:hypothetical protein FDG2_4197 [Candidatus Protofrankia californiensis]|uniref:Uncharacterized protein n=1 Tax=Candidatus Protofrankia californiensis TaxID=1839754 RepID=A0A1C3P441_9ACTN|nr:hypothetical protein FDG2_4197 [Candidatus Protofrankia californiensis]
MDRPRKKIHVVGERRAQLDVARFADALIALALRRLNADTEADPAAQLAAEPGQERPS